MEAENTTATAKSVNPDEISHFASMAETWWDPNGPFKPLHQLNPTRIEFIRNEVCRHFDRDPLTEMPLKDLRILDIGCGGGLLCEPMARLGATIVGADAAEKNIKTASIHADQMGLNIDYRFITAEELAENGEKFDVILNMEVIEHVADIASFLNACHQLLKDDGCMTLSTLNRTLKSWTMAIAGAEYLLRWLPVGTHDWKKFLKPSELSMHALNSGFTIMDLKGMVYNPLNGKWSLNSHDFSVNYVALAVKSHNG
ncbi:MAG: bifunctional 2-polyprenyl-6-hydroxyphenol methylase/3-demethylubiquinol 3-O-methyltransferase UbiG [Kordiimonadaceae bacterium]|nr:bifunctional 2-polyprenyl-6-hydroxyphenol methylase/3-demethylubiquinol 3-O-methyltransferase UbiG [Kordiimonadaceae bacterium]MBT6033295.1 bifunctional 2-polyprenyl-6-hydroxyphenol methylase/3-demethylubiquinol 3-O-methyltransferase UbiG [Kordiimonadaceae bacterium]